MCPARAEKTRIGELVCPPQAPLIKSLRFQVWDEMLITRWRNLMQANQNGYPPNRGDLRFSTESACCSARR
jgi:hypothetical protein